MSLSDEEVERRKHTNSLKARSHDAHWTKGGYPAACWISHISFRDMLVILDISKDPRAKSKLPEWNLRVNIYQDIMTKEHGALAKGFRVLVNLTDESGTAVGQYDWESLNPIRDGRFYAISKPSEKYNLYNASL